VDWVRPPVLPSPRACPDPRVDWVHPSPRACPDQRVDWVHPSPRVSPDPRVDWVHPSPRACPRPACRRLPPAAVWPRRPWHDGPATPPPYTAVTGPAWCGCVCACACVACPVPCCARQRAYVKRFVFGAARAWARRCTGPARAVCGSMSSLHGRAPCFFPNFPSLPLLALPTWCLLPPLAACAPAPSVPPSPRLRLTCWMPGHRPPRRGTWRLREAPLARLTMTATRTRGTGTVSSRCGIACAAHMLLCTACARTAQLPCRFDCTSARWRAPMHCLCLLCLHAPCAPQCNNPAAAAPSTVAAGQRQRRRGGRASR
jgi:hypothetical protein